MIGMVFLPCRRAPERIAANRGRHQKIRSRILRLFQPWQQPSRFPLAARERGWEESHLLSRCPRCRIAPPYGRRLARGSAGVAGPVRDLHLAGEPRGAPVGAREQALAQLAARDASVRDAAQATGAVRVGRSEEHTSELQSLTNLVCRLLLEKKKTQN